MTWTLSDAAAAADNNLPRIPYDGGGPWSASNCAPALLAHAKRLADMLRARFAWVRTIGGTRCESHTINGERQMSIHAVGRALDVFTRDGGGDDLANWLVENAKLLGIQLVIWDHSVWQSNLAPGARLQPYTGPNAHTDHVHVEVTQAPGPALAAPAGILATTTTAQRVVAIVVILSSAAAATWILWPKAKR